MNGKRFSEERTRKNGFYLALAVCLVAVGIAAWSAYDAVRSYLPDSAPETSSLNELQGQDVRSRPEKTSPVDEDPEKPANASPAKPVTAEVTKQPVTKPSAEPYPTVQPTPQPTPESTPAPVPVNGPIYEISPEMISPLKTEGILKDYSAGAPVYSQTMKDWRIHTGTDFAAEAGEEVRACANGQIRETYSDAMKGNVIVVEHGDYVFSYCGVSEDFRVQPGDIVSKGQTIGTVTAVPSESADPPHLHVEVRRDGVWQDPQAVIENRN